MTITEVRHVSVVLDECGGASAERSSGGSIHYDALLRSAPDHGTDIRQPTRRLPSQVVLRT